MDTVMPAASVDRGQKCRLENNAEGLEGPSHDGSQNRGRPLLGFFGLVNRNDSSDQSPLPRTQVPLAEGRAMVLSFVPPRPGHTRPSLWPSGRLAR